MPKLLKSIPSQALGQVASTAGHIMAGNGWGFARSCFRQCGKTDAWVCGYLTAGSRHAFDCTYVASSVHKGETPLFLAVLSSGTRLPAPCPCCCAPIAPVLPSHLSAIMATCLALASGHAPAAPPRRTSTDNHKHHAAAENGEQQQHDDREDAAAEAALAVALAVDEDSLGSLVSELLGALEDVSGRALGACRLIADFAKATRHDIEDHVDDLLTVRGLRFCGDVGVQQAAGLLSGMQVLNLPRPYKMSSKIVLMTCSR